MANPGTTGDAGSQGGLLYYGDNLDILRRYVDDESIDLIYLDPPFNSAIPTGQTTTHRIPSPS